VREPTALQPYSAITTASNGARNICFDRHNNLIVPMYWTDEVLAYDVTSCQLLCKVAEGQHKAPCACVEDSKGRLFVSECGDDCVAIFNNWNVLQKKLAVHRPGALALDATEKMIYVCGHNTVNVLCISDGSVVREIGRGILGTVDGVAVLSTSMIVVNSSGGRHQVSVFHYDGDVASSFAVGDRGQRSQVACDSHDNIYVAHRTEVLCGVKGNRTISCDTAVAVVSLVGARFSRFGIEKESDDGFVGIAISQSGLVAVSTFFGHTIKVFSCGEM
jgi:hypothetical protein